MDNNYSFNFLFFLIVFLLAFLLNQCLPMFKLQKALLSLAFSVSETVVLTAHMLYTLNLARISEMSSLNFWR